MNPSQRHISDAALLQEIASGRLNPEIFTHEAHLRLAWILIRSRGVESAVKDVATLIKKYVEQLGVGHKYNHTVTVAAVYAVDHFIRKREIGSFQTFIETYPQLLTNFKDLLQSHYSIDIFHSKHAQTTFIEADLQGF
jgi:N-formylglutamate deformylase